MNIFRLIQIHLELTCVTFDHRGDLIHLPCPDSEALPRVYIGHHPRGYITLFHHAVLPTLRDEINALSPELAFREPTRVQQILERQAPCKKIGSSKSYFFRERISPEFFPDVTPLDNAHSQLFSDASRIAHQTVFAIVKNGEIVSACESARENKHAAEAWVRTQPEYQRNGYARQTTLAWAYDLQRKNKLPFYSHQIDDTDSEALALSLGAGHWITDLSFS